MTPIRNRLLDVLRRHNIDGLAFDEARSLPDNGFDSYSFIETTVYIEQEFGVEFSDDGLNLNRYATLNDFLTQTECLVSDTVAASLAQ